MSSAHADPHASDAVTGPHGSPDDHGETHGHDDHGHADEAVPLGRVDMMAWGAGAVGIAAGLAVALVLAISAS
jgi:hypothetical protein